MSLYFFPWALPKVCLFVLKIEEETYLQQSLQGTYMLKWKLKILFTQSCPTLCNPMDCSPPGSSVQEILTLGKNTRGYRYSILQGILPTLGSNTGLLNCRQILYCLSYQGEIYANFPKIKLCLFPKQVWCKTEWNISQQQHQSHHRKTNTLFIKSKQFQRDQNASLSFTNLPWCVWHLDCWLLVEF